MKTFYISFSGYCEIKAHNEEEAEEKFWDAISDNHLNEDVWEVEGIEEKIE